MESSHCIGGDLLLEILSWLPAKTIIKYTSSISKTLSTLRIDPMFIKRQSFRSSLLDNGFFLQHEICFNKLDFFVLPNELPTLFGIPDESLTFLRQNGRVLASSQGLVLHRNDAGKILICNPVTRSCTQLPIPENYKSLGFKDFGISLECHASNLAEAYNFPNDYTVILPVCVEEDDNPWGSDYHLAMYRNGKWDDDLCYLRKEKGRDLRLDAPVVVFNGHNGGLVVHYICNSFPYASRIPVYLEPYVLAYDVEKKELWRRIKLPQGAWEDGDNEKLQIFKWGSDQTIALLRSDPRMLSVWVLEDYASSSWRRVVSKTTSEMGVTEENDVVTCCVFNGRRLVFSTKTRVYVCDIEAERAELVGEHGFHEFPNVIFTPYANTLRPVRGGETASVVTF